MRSTAFTPTIARATTRRQRRRAGRGCRHGSAITARCEVKRMNGWVDGWIAGRSAPRIHPFIVQPSILPSFRLPARLPVPRRLPLTVLLFAFIASAGWGAERNTGGDIAEVIQRYQLEQAPDPVRERSNWRKPQRILVSGPLVRIVDELRAAAPDVEFIVADPQQAVEQAANVDALFGICAPDV